MQTYLVGGAVRDTLLGLPITDQDWVVVGTTPTAMLELGYEQIGSDFPVFLHPRTKQEYALARTERKSGHGYTGFTCYAAADVTLEQDLLRRDLTINAIAKINRDNSSTLIMVNMISNIRSYVTFHPHLAKIHCEYYALPVLPHALPT